MDIKEEDPLSDDLDSQNETEFFTNNVAMKTNSNVVLLNDCHLAINSQTPSSDFSSQSESEFLPEHHVFTIGSSGRNSPLLCVKKCSSDHEGNNKIEIKEEPLQLEASVCDHIKDEDFCIVKPARSCTEAASGDSNGKSALLSAEDLRKDESFYKGKNHHEHGHSGSLECQKRNVTETHSVKQTIQPVRSSGSMASHSKQSNLTHEGNRPHKCQICEKRFTRLSHLQLHNLIHEGKRPHICEICEKRFTKLSDLKRHILIHDGKKPHKCQICEKQFTRLSNLKSHHLIHETEKPHKCGICEKSFTRLSDWKTHNLIHEGKKPHKCEVCDKRFTRLSDLKSHNLTHDGKKPHKCEVCDKRFIALWDLKRHNLIHGGIKPYKCEVCNKRFTALSSLRRHKLIHERKEPYICEICESGFIALSEFKKHILIYESRKTQV